ncbi:MAG: 3-hydroxybutyrate dehydrogenase [Bdellovibrionota bacterium]
MKVAIVTGGSSGIGLAIVENFRAKGMKAISWDLTPPENRDIPFLRCDVSSETSVSDAWKETTRQLGEAEVLVNNAGLQHLSPLENFSLEKWNQLLGVILTGTFLCSRAAIPSMKANRRGRIINISSIHGKVASPYKAAYVAAKHGVLGLSKVMAQELGEFEVTVNSICPGFVDTPLLRKQIQVQAELNKISPGQVQNEIMLKPQVVKHFTSPQQIADLVFFLCSASAATITGEAYNMAGGWGMGT